MGAGGAGQAGQQGRSRVKRRSNRPALSVRQRPALPGAVGRTQGGGEEVWGEGVCTLSIGRRAVQCT